MSRSTAARMSSRDAICRTAGDDGAVAGNTSTPGASVTSRALGLLACFDDEHRRLTLTALAHRAGVPVGTAHRLVAELSRWGALERAADGHYVVGRRIWDLGRLAPVQAGLVETASPYLHDLYGATRATVHLAVRDGLQVLYLDRLRGHTSVPVVSTIGSRLPLHSTGVGKILLAHAPPEIRKGALSRLVRVTPYTITQPGQLIRELDRALVDGYATTSEEMSLGACSVAVPVVGEGEVVAALGLVVASLKRDRARLVAALDVAARGVARAWRG